MHNFHASFCYDDILKILIINNLSKKMETQTPPLICPSHTKEYVGALLVGILIGTGASFLYLKQSGGAPAGVENTYEAGFNDAKNRLLESPFGGMINTQEDIRNVSGSVTKVDGNRLTISTPSANPFADLDLASRIIIVNEETQIIELKPKDAKVFETEMAAFLKKVNAPKTATQPMLTPPEPFISTVISVSDIKVGDVISATAEENIRSLKEFSVTEIRIEPKNEL